MLEPPFRAGHRGGMHHPFCLASKSFVAAVNRERKGFSDIDALLVHLPLPATAAKGFPAN